MAALTAKSHLLEDPSFPSKTVASCHHCLVRNAGAWLEVLQNLLAAMQIPHRIVIGERCAHEPWQGKLQTVVQAPYRKTRCLPYVAQPGASWCSVWQSPLR